jgi:hypothetical protein
MTITVHYATASRHLLPILHPKTFSFLAYLDPGTDSLSLELPLCITLGIRNSGSRRLVLVTIMVHAAFIAWSWNSTNMGMNRCNNGTLATMFNIHFNQRTHSYLCSSLLPLSLHDTDKVLEHAHATLSHRPPITCTHPPPCKPTRSIRLADTNGANHKLYDIYTRKHAQLC